MLRHHCTECDLVREERAAVYEFDGGLPRDEAERRAEGLTCEFAAVASADRAVAVSRPETRRNAAESDDRRPDVRTAGPEPDRGAARQIALFGGGDR